MTRAVTQQGRKKTPPDYAKAMIRVLIILLILQSSTALPSSEEFAINLHVIRRDHLNGLIYGQLTAVTESQASRMNVKFSTLVSEEKCQETYSLDQCLPKGERPTKEELEVSFRKFTKMPCWQTCRGSRPATSNLKKTIKLLLNDDPYMHIVQHSDSKKMLTHDGNFKFHQEVKSGSIKKLKCNKTFFPSSTHRMTFAYQLNRWLKHAQKSDYGQPSPLPRYLRPFSNEGYQDFLFGTNCCTGIMEVKVNSQSRGPHPGLAFFDYSHNYALVLEVLPSQAHQPSASQCSGYGELTDIKSPQKKREHLQKSSSLPRLAGEVIRPITTGIWPRGVEYLHPDGSIPVVSNPFGRHQKPRQF
ncbi:hypothetical protein [Sansalvadorimonas verongulae]|uniref:hypothetical protein n=1 Tax=Sansalvadorimonas verongulae TaxID=2172824 RepID=UPI0012BBE2D4|nr:hypothetical protein [Sansalvadorimonas verongulae]MTI14095.1 hypothetical protein [Sansalvadorimonas verongulae]